MGPKPPAVAFEPPFYRSTNYTIPEDCEAELIEAYTAACGAEPDMVFAQIRPTLRAWGVPPEVIVLDQPDWCIGDTDVVDIDKWLYEGHFWLLLSRNIGIVDTFWGHLVAGGDRRASITLQDLQTMVQDVKLDLDTRKMFSIATETDSISYVDLFRILGRIGFIPL